MSAKILKKLIIFTIISLGVSCQPSLADPRGSFKGEIVTRWLKDGRKMELLKDFTFVDPQGVAWMAPAGAIVDGASIPKVFWSVIGGPYEGPYRIASVIHDYYCDTWKKHDRSWESVHTAFFDAMLAAGVPMKQAKVMYIAVRECGPRWPRGNRSFLPGCGNPIGGSGPSVNGGVADTTFDNSYLWQINEAELHRFEAMADSELRGELGSPMRAPMPGTDSAPRLPQGHSLPDVPPARIPPNP